MKYMNNTLCESLDSIRLAVKKSSLKQSEKIYILEYLEEAQVFGNKLEDKLIEKIEILKEEGFVKCVHCKVWERPQSGIDGPVYSCCGALIM